MTILFMWGVYTILTGNILHTFYQYKYLILLLEYLLIVLLENLIVLLEYLIVQLE